MSADRFTVKNAIIDWDCVGKFKFTSGYGATKAEHGIANYAACLAPVVMYLFSWKGLDWSITQIIVASVLALDMVGGVLTNSLGSMKRFLHTDKKLDLSWLGKLVGSKFLFPLIHIQIFVVPLFFDISWGYAFFWYGIMVGSILLIHCLPLYLHRTVAMLVVMLSVMIGPIAFVPPEGLEWLASIYMIKLVLSHGVREEPYRP